MGWGDCWSGKEVEEAVMDLFKQSKKIMRNSRKPIIQDKNTRLYSNCVPSEQNPVSLIPIQKVGLVVTRDQNLEVTNHPDYDVEYTGKQLPTFKSGRCLNLQGLSSPRTLSEHDVLSLNTWFSSNTSTNTSHFAHHGFAAGHGKRTVPWFSEWQVYVFPTVRLT
jgi:hypothetical protein